MYLSRIILPRENHEVVKALSSLQVMHAILQNCVPEGSPRTLWRIDRLGSSLVLLFQTQSKPCHTPFGLSQWETRDYQVVLEKLQVKQLFRFRFCGNPVHRVKVASSARGKIMAYVTIAQQKEWLLQQASRHGFSIWQPETEPLFDVVERSTQKFRRQQATVTLSTAVFEGVLQIEDASLLIDAMKEGIGRGKAYGCGMLTLARM